MVAAVVSATGEVVNMIVADADVDAHPEGFVLVNVPDGSPIGIGWSYIDGEFVPPSPPSPPEPPPGG